MRYFFLIILSLFICLSDGFAAAYYIDFATGADTNNGTTTGTPFKHCPGDDNATDTAASTTLSADDSVIFKGGIEYLGRPDLDWSGSSGQPITYDGNSSGAWGTGKAIIDGSDTRYYGFYATRSKSYITINNFEIRNLARNPVTEWENGGVYIDGLGGDPASTDITISNCYIHNVGYWENDAAFTPLGTGIKIYKPTNCLVDSNEITKTGGGGISFSGGSSSVISNNNIHDYVNWGIDINGDEGATTDHVITGNTFYDLYRYDAGFWPNGDPPHTDFIFIRQGSGTRPDGIIVEKNLFYNNYTFSDFGGTAMVFLSFADNTIIRNNVFINPHSFTTVGFNWTSDGTKFYNNTVYSPRTGGIRSVAGSVGNIGIKNNIMVVGSNAFYYDDTDDENGLDMDNNLYWINTSAQAFHRDDPFFYKTFAEWQTFGYDLNSSNVANISDIKFKDISSYPTGCQNMQLEVIEGSPVIDVGVTIASFSDDYNGTVRPQGAAWEIGAYEFLSGGISFDGANIQFSGNIQWGNP